MGRKKTEMAQLLPITNCNMSGMASHVLDDGVNIYSRKCGKTPTTVHSTANVDRTEPGHSTSYIGRIGP